MWVESLDRSLFRSDATHLSVAVGTVVPVGFDCVKWSLCDCTVARGFGATSGKDKHCFYSSLYIK